MGLSFDWVLISFSSFQNEINLYFHFEIFVILWFVSLLWSDPTFHFVVSGLTYCLHVEMGGMGFWRDPNFISSNLRALSRMAFNPQLSTYTLSINDFNVTSPHPPLPSIISLMSMQCLFGTHLYFLLYKWDYFIKNGRKEINSIDDNQCFRVAVTHVESGLYGQFLFFVSFPLIEYLYV